MNIKIKKMKEAKPIHPPGMYVSWPKKEKAAGKSNIELHQYFKKCKNILYTLLKTG